MSFSLRAGIAIPILYFGTVIVSSLFYPGYNHVRQYASELGSAEAPLPMLFNGGILLTGIASLVAAPGFVAALRRLRGNAVLAWLLAIILALFGVSMIMGGLFPMPDPRHGGFGLGLGVHAGPALLAAALWRREDARLLRGFLLVTTVLVVAMFAIMMGVGGLVTRANVGVFQRVYALTLFPWMGIGSWALLRRVSSRAEGQAGMPASRVDI